MKLEKFLIQSNNIGMEYGWKHDYGLSVCDHVDDFDESFRVE